MASGALTVHSAAGSCDQIDVPPRRTAAGKGRGDYWVDRNNGRRLGLSSPGRGPRGAGRVRARRPGSGSRHKPVPDQSATAVRSASELQGKAEHLVVHGTPGGLDTPRARRSKFQHRARRAARPPRLTNTNVS
jgi:hypothetical protein